MNRLYSPLYLTINNKFVPSFLAVDTLKITHTYNDFILPNFSSNLLKTQDEFPIFYYDSTQNSYIGKDLAISFPYLPIFQDSTVFSNLKLHILLELVLPENGYNYEMSDIKKSYTAYMQQDPNAYIYASGNLKFIEEVFLPTLYPNAITLASNTLDASNIILYDTSFLNTYASIISFGRFLSDGFIIKPPRFFKEVIQTLTYVKETTERQFLAVNNPEVYSKIQKTSNTFPDKLIILFDNPILLPAQKLYVFSDILLDEAFQFNMLKNISWRLSGLINQFNNRDSIISSFPGDYTTSFNNLLHALNINILKNWNMQSLRGYFRQIYQILYKIEVFDTQNTFDTYLDFTSNISKTLVNNVYLSTISDYSDNSYKNFSINHEEFTNLPYTSPLLSLFTPFINRFIINLSNLHLPSILPLSYLNITFDSTNQIIKLALLNENDLKKTPLYAPITFYNPILKEYCIFNVIAIDEDTNTITLANTQENMAKLITYIQNNWDISDIQIYPPVIIGKLTLIPVGRFNSLYSNVIRFLHAVKISYFFTNHKF